MLKSLQVLTFFPQVSHSTFQVEGLNKGPEIGLLEVGCRKQNQGDNLLSWTQMEDANVYVWICE